MLRREFAVRITRLLANAYIAILVLSALLLLYYFFATDSFTPLFLDFAPFWLVGGVAPFSILISITRRLSSRITISKLDIVAICIVILCFVFQTFCNFMFLDAFFSPDDSSRVDGQFGMIFIFPSAYLELGLMVAYFLAFTSIRETFKSVLYHLRELKVSQYVVGLLLLFVPFFIFSTLFGGSLLFSESTLYISREEMKMVFWTSFVIVSGLFLNFIIAGFLAGIWRLPRDISVLYRYFYLSAAMLSLVSAPLYSIEPLPGVGVWPGIGAIFLLSLGILFYYVSGGIVSALLIEGKSVLPVKIMIYALFAYSFSKLVIFHINGTDGNIYVIDSTVLFVFITFGLRAIFIYFIYDSLRAMKSAFARMSRR